MGFRKPLDRLKIGVRFNILFYDGLRVTGMFQ